METRGKGQDKMESEERDDGKRNMKGKLEL